MYNNIHYIHIITLYIYIDILYSTYAMLWRIVSPIVTVSPDHQGPVEFGGVDRVPSSSSSNLFWITATWWLESGSEWKQKRLKEQVGFQTHVDVEGVHGNLSWNCIGNPIKVPYHPLSKAMAQLQLGLCTWRRWRSCLLAAWLSLIQS